MYDYESCNNLHIDINEFISICKKENVILIQYRDKINSQKIQQKNLTYFKKNINIPLIINDNLNLLKYCDGLHLGQEDLTLLLSRYKLKDKQLIFKILKKIYSNKIFGLSTHNEFEVLESNHFNIDYIGLGAYRRTSTKNVSNVIGENISYLAQVSKHKVGAIGGVKKNDIIRNIDFNVICSDLISKKII